MTAQKIDRVQAVVIALAVAMLTFVVCYKVSLWAWIRYWESQHDGRRMIFLFWAEERALLPAFLVCVIVSIFTITHLQRRLSS